jgi:hypothetical protein
MLLSGKMITGFNTDVPHEGRVYHVQTEDRGKEHPFLESLIYIGGTIVAKKQTPYSEQLNNGATEELIAGLLKRQHQVIIAAIKAGRIEDLIRLTARGSAKEQAQKSAPADRQPGFGLLPESPVQQPVRPPTPPPVAQMPTTPVPARPATTSSLGSPRAPSRVAKSGSLNLDQVISDYLKRTSEQGRLDLKVLTPNLFTAGKSIGLRVQVSNAAKHEPDALVTVKIIGTAFKPQVYVGRAASDGVASFSLTLPLFTAGTAAIVIEAQSSHGRGELKHLIRRA